MNVLITFVNRLFNSSQDIFAVNANDVDNHNELKTRSKEYLAMSKTSIIVLFNVQPRFLGKKIQKRTMKLTFNSNYFVWFLLLLATEIAIALFLKTGFIRHTFGDFLVVILMYCFFKSFYNTQPLTIGIMVLLIAFTIEFLQLFNVLEYLNLSQITIVNIIFGNTFQLGDLLAYTFGILTILIIEHKFNSHKSLKNSSH